MSDLDPSVDYVIQNAQIATELRGYPPDDGQRVDVVAGRDQTRHHGTPHAPGADEPDFTGSGPLAPARRRPPAARLRG
jgi:hypothetical protein